jgi:hypothetical protein
VILHASIRLTDAVLGSVFEPSAWHLARVDEGLQQPRLQLNSCNADGDQASQLQHAVQNMDSGANLGGATPFLQKRRPMAISTRLRVM